MRKESQVQSFIIYCKKCCPRRALSASRNYQYFIRNGLRPTNDPKKADLIIIHSCGAFGIDEEFSLLTLKKALKIKSKSCKVIMTGCLPKINNKALTPFKEALIIPTEKLAALDSIIEAKFPYNSIRESASIHGVNDLYHGTFINRITRNFVFNENFVPNFKHWIRRELNVKTNNVFFDTETYKITIEHGCLGDCTFCAIKFANPKFNSVPEEQIMETFKLGLRQNYTNFALTGADIGAYGIDTGTNLAKLLEKLLAIKGEYKISLIDLNARWFIKNYEELFYIIKKNVAKFSTIIVPIQSGSNRILSLMNRHYTADDVKRRISDFQQNIPNVKVETHIMVGFPGETENDFQLSLNLVRDIHFSKVEVYRYEDRPGTTASNFPNKNSDVIINKRIKTLKKLLKLYC